MGNKKEGVSLATVNGLIQALTGKLSTEVQSQKSAIVPLNDEVFINIEASSNLYDSHSDDMTLALNSEGFSQGTSLVGFYVPIDPSINTTVTVQRAERGMRFRVVSCQNVPAVGTTYSSGKVVNWDDVKKIVYDKIVSTDRYLYVAYYSTTQDTKTKSELLSGMEIYYGTEQQNTTSRKISRIDELYYNHETGFVNGSINSSGVFSGDTKSITSDFIHVEGSFMISVPSDYVMKIHLFDDEGNYKSTTQKTNSVSLLSHYGLARFSISASNNSSITPETVDFSKIKMPSNRYTARSYTNKKTFVLDAENCTDSDIYAYIDETVASHGVYATKTLLCTESSGLPIYYYTIGNGTKKVCIVGGQHGAGNDGDPRDGVITVAKFIRDLIDGNFSNDSFLKELHDDYTVLVIPVLNPYGFNNRTRTDANDDDPNRDWTSPSTIEVTAAKTLISTFSPNIALDVHCNGTTPVYNEDITIQFGLGTYNSTYKSAVQSKFKSYYDTDVGERTPNTEDTLQYYIITTLGILGGLLELRWWSKSRKWMHDAQAESANYAMLVNALRFCGATHDSHTYTWEHTPNQNQY